MQAVLNLAWAHLLLAFTPHSLTADTGATDALQQKLAALALPAVDGAPTSPMQASVTGKTYRFEANTQKAKSITFDFTPEGCTITWQQGRTRHRFGCAFGAWREGITTFATRTLASILWRPLVRLWRPLVPGPQPTPTRYTFATRRRPSVPHSPVASPGIR